MFSQITEQNLCYRLFWIPVLAGCILNKCQILTFHMKFRDHEQHIQLFERQFLFEHTQEQLKVPQYNLPPIHEPFDNIAQSIMVLQTKSRNNYKQEKPKIQSESQTVSQKSIKAIPSKRAFKFYFKLYVLQVIIAYCITVGLMYLNKVVYFPFFEAIMIIIITYSLKPFKFTNIMILLSIPMAIANYSLGIWVLTYPEIIICYFSVYVFTKPAWKNLIWILTTVLYAIFGFIVLASIGAALKSKSKTNLIILYYIYPWLLVIIKTLGGLLNQFSIETNHFLLQISFFFTGITYGILLTLPLQSIQFWYLLVLLTLEIINTRFQFSIRLCKHLLRIYRQAYEQDYVYTHNKKINIIQCQSSGYACVNSFHLVILVYLICKLQLNSVRFSYNLQKYVQYWYLPLVIWLFFCTYQIVALVRLRKCQNVMIIGFKNNEWKQSIIRAIALTLGLWFFYLGLCIPYNIFLV